MARTTGTETGSPVSGRKVKLQVFEILEDASWETRLPELLELPSAKVVGPLFSSLYNADPLVKWHGVTAFGLIVPAMADQRMESGRIVLRRCMWSLSDESGGIGWGIPETMGEILTNHKTLAEEFHSILLSYIKESEDSPDNYLEYAPLRRGAVWAAGRLAETKPDLAVKAAADLRSCLSDPDASIRGTACWALGFLQGHFSPNDLEPLLFDDANLDLYKKRKLASVTVAGLAREALEGTSGGTRI